MRLVFDNNYFNDKYQGIPIGGYNRLIDRLFEGVECKMEVNFSILNIGIGRNMQINLYILVQLMNSIIMSLENLIGVQFVLRPKRLIWQTIKVTL